MKKIDSFSNEHAFLSNFYPSMVYEYGYVFPTVEHGYQAIKCTKIEEFLRIHGAKTPGLAKKLGRVIEIRSDWEQIKEAVMLSFLRQKFHTGPLMESLVRTGELELIEGNTWGDRYWGVYKGAGQNRLGILLMQVREELRNV